MNRCPITYELVNEGRYSVKGMKMLSPTLKKLVLLDYSAEELRAEAMLRASKMSIQGVQPKLSAILSVKDGRFDIVDKGGRYILKPQHPIFPELPENEDLTMRMAASIGIEIPVHGLIYGKDGVLTYFIKRFDRKGQKDKIAVEDFAQLAGLSRDTKYNYSMEKLLKLIDETCTFPAIEKAKLFKRVIFNYLVGNSDAHAKNLSLLYGLDNTSRLSPFYDLIAIHAWPSHVFNHHLALSIGGESNTHKVKRSHWEQLADDCAISFSLFENSIGKLSEGVIDAFERAQKRFEYENGAYPAFQQVKQALLKNQRLLKKAFK